LSDVVIRAEGLGKKYAIGRRGPPERYVALRDVIARAAIGFARSARDMLLGRLLIEGDEVEDFWALKDVGFQVKRGETLGVIGRNGAGKSTLLKVLSRITEPSAGRVEIKGRVASLLDVGAGFHPELTGAENIYLNGAILGMGRLEIRRKFDEIVAFANVEKFLDTPVKRYSSGMYMRLAFAVAAHLEPEILVVDEVLAVGDTEFQQKCLGKIGQVARGGRTVLFVSHNLGAVQALCQSAILLDAGRLERSGQAAETVGYYASRLAKSRPEGLTVLKHDHGRLEVSVRANEGRPIQSSGRAAFAVEVVSSVSDCLYEACLLLHSLSGTRLGIVDLRVLGAVPVNAGPCERVTLCFAVETLPLVEGVYEIGLFLRTRHWTGDAFPLAQLTISPGPQALGFAPYPPTSRGFLEFGVSGDDRRANGRERTPRREMSVAEGEA